MGLVQGVSYWLLGMVDLLFLWAAFTKFQHRVSTADKFQAIGLGEGYMHSPPTVFGVRTARGCPLCVAWLRELGLLLLCGFVLRAHVSGLIHVTLHHTLLRRMQPSTRQGSSCKQPGGCWLLLS
jgi:hypothetical protein